MKNKIALIIFFILPFMQVEAQTLDVFTLGEKLKSSKSIKSNVFDIEGIIYVSTSKDSTITEIKFVSNKPLESSEYYSFAKKVQNEYNINLIAFSDKKNADTYLLSTSSEYKLEKNTDNLGYPNEFIFTIKALNNSETRWFTQRMNILDEGKPTSHLTGKVFFDNENSVFVNEYKDVDKLYGSVILMKSAILLSITDRTCHNEYLGEDGRVFIKITNDKKHEEFVFFNVRKHHLFINKQDVNYPKVINLMKKSKHITFSFVNTSQHISKFRISCMGFSKTYKDVINY